MKKLLIPLLCAMLLATCMLSACKSGDYLFTFISVRLKGNGDGTVTAVAQNEFALSAEELPVTLTLYFSDSYETDTSKMTAVKACGENLTFSEKASFEYKLENGGYYCAKIEYTAGRETRYLQTDTVYYDLDGNRK